MKKLLSWNNTGLFNRVKVRGKISNQSSSCFLIPPKILSSVTFNLITKQQFFNEIAGEVLCAKSVEYL
jgi:hypothetical protein